MGKKIIFVVNKFPPQVDGVGDYTFHLSKALLKKDYEISLITNDTWSDQASSIQSPYNIYPIASNWQSPLNWIRIYKKIAVLNPDFTILQYVPYSFHRKGLPVGMLFLSLIIRFFTKGKFLVFFHEVRIKINPRRLKSLLLGIPMWLISGSIHLLSQQSLTSNQHYRKLLNRYCKDSRVIPIGSSIPCNTAYVSIDPQVLGSCKDNFVLGVFGFGIRGMDVLFETTAKLKKHIKGLKLIALGAFNNSTNRVIKDKIAKYDLESDVIIPGYLPANQIAFYFQQIDIFLSLDSYQSKDQWTGTGTKSSSLATAMNFGKPIIGTKGELTDDTLLSESIMLLDELSVQSLSAAILTLANDQSKREYLGQMALQIHKKAFAWGHISDTYEEILSQLNTKNLDG